MQKKQGRNPESFLVFGENHLIFRKHEHRYKANFEIWCLSDPNWIRLILLTKSKWSINRGLQLPSTRSTPDARSHFLSKNYPRPNATSISKQLFSFTKTQNPTPLHFTSNLILLQFHHSNSRLPAYHLKYDSFIVRTIRLWYFRKYQRLTARARFCEIATRQKRILIAQAELSA